MALQACHECGHQVSSEASSCPSCGAPVRPPALTFGESVNRAATGAPEGVTLPGWVKGAAWVFGSLFLVAGAAAAVGAFYSTPQAQAAPTLPEAKPAVEAKPAHNYSRMYGGSYAYPIVPKLSDRRQGLTSRDMQPILVEFYGEKAGRVRFALYAPENVGHPIQYECPRPLTQCETDAGWTDVRSGTVLAAVLQDAANGYLHVQPPPPMPPMRLTPTRPASS